MKQGKSKIDTYSVQSATDMASRIGNDSLKSAINWLNDTKKKERLEKCECKTCFYIRGKMGGQAITDRPCGICEEEQTYGSTCTDMMCLPCGKKNELCVHCGADIRLRPRRTYK
ncbi:MAG TPA: hypothetical protein VMW10_11000 [Alphaproteobacteria bacterium]|nr:hypothetical protein [Alphaproteobacteria bacterium]